MRILLVLHPSGNFSLSNSMTWYRNLYEPLIDSGHIVNLLRLDEFAKSRKIPFRSDKFKYQFSREFPDVVSKLVCKSGIDFILTYLTDLDISVESLEQISQLQIPMANFSCNNTHQFQLIRNISPLFTYCLHSEKDVRDKFLAINANPVHFQMAANPRYYRVMNIDYTYDITFVGMNYARRLFYIEYLAVNNIPVHCFGPKWLLSENEWLKKKLKVFYYRALNMLAYGIDTIEYRKYWIKAFLAHKDFTRNYPNLLHPGPSDNELIRIFNQSRINLGFLEVFKDNNRPGSEIAKHLHLREFEVPMSGGLYITNFSVELAENYEPDKEVLVFNDETELKYKIEYYLSKPAEADKIRKAGYQRAQNCHTWQHRFEKFFARHPFN